MIDARHLEAVDFAQQKIDAGTLPEEFDEHIYEIVSQLWRDLPMVPVGNWQEDRFLTGAVRHLSVLSPDSASYASRALATSTATVNSEAWHQANEKEKRIQYQILHDIFGNPFRPVAFDPAWRTSTALAIAQGIYDDRAFDRLPILADALQDAGCENGDILSHLRGEGPHVKGCWALDLVLGKE
jgi:hypothetical protein